MPREPLTQKPCACQHAPPRRRSTASQAQNANPPGAILGPGSAPALNLAPAPGPSASFKSLPRLILLQTNQNGQVFSGTFNGLATSQANATTNTPPALQLEYTAPFSGLQVYNLNESVLNANGVGVQSEGGFGDVTSADQQTAKIQAFCQQLLVENSSAPHLSSAQRQF